jgi:hypothetical protein
MRRVVEMHANWEQRPLPILDGIQTVEFAALGESRAVEIDGSQLKVSPVDIEAISRLTDDLEKQRALGVMYALHELVHVAQQASGMNRIAEVRFAGAECALMHLDLGADHRSAVIAASAFPKWHLEWLKDLQGQAIRGFPAGPRHPPYSRVRKVLRLVGLRTDLALRRLGLGSEHLKGDSYGFADFAPAGGSFIAMVNGPPFSIVKVGLVTSGDVGVFFEGIEGGEGGIERVDRAIERALSGDSWDSDSERCPVRLGSHPGHGLHR